jgi:hypothetical protein
MEPLRARTGGETKRLGERGRGVLENARTEKRRFDPDRVERRNCGEETDWLRNDNERRGSRMLDFAGSDQSDRALVLTLSRIRMEALVQFRRNRQHQRKNKRGEKSGRGDGAQSGNALHFGFHRNVILPNNRIKAIANCADRLLLGEKTIRFCVTLFSLYGKCVRRERRSFFACEQNSFAIPTSIYRVAGTVEAHCCSQISQATRHAHPNWRARPFVNWRLRAGETAVR